MNADPLQVLVVEDSPNDAELTIYELTRAGYAVKWDRVANEKEYLAALGPHIDLILADYNLPQFNALRALHLLQQTGLDIPLIVVTGSIEEVAIECMKQGAADYLLKDRLGRLEQAVERALAQKSLRDEKRRAEEALRNNEELFRQLAENVHDIFWVLEADTGKVIYLSPAYETVSGRSRWPLYDSPFGLLRAIYPGDFKLLRQTINQFARNEPIHGQYRLVRPDRSMRWIEARTYPIYNDNQQLYRWVGVAEDITERKLAEEQLQQYTERLQVLDSISRNLTDILQDYHSALKAVVRQVAEFLGDACGIALLLENEDKLTPIAITHTNPEAEAVLWAVTASIPLDDALVNQLIYSREPLFLTQIDDMVFRESLLPPNAAYIERFGLSGLIGVALRAQGRVIGAIGALRDRGQPAYTPDDLSFLQELANRIALTVIDSRLYAENLRRLENMQALREIDTAISGSVEMQISLKVILEKATSQLGVDAASILTYDPHLQMLEYAAGRGFRSRLIKQAQVALDASLSGRAILDNREISIADWSATPPGEFENVPQFVELLTTEGFVAYYAKPLIAKGEVQGVFEIFHRTPLLIEKEWLDFFDSLAGQAAIAINNANLLTNLRRTNAELVLAYNETIQGWSRALDLRDRETEGHTQRVTEMTERLARAMGFSGERLAHIRRGALLHDMGKMGVRDDILLKPDKLTEGEWVEMRKHPIYAYNMLAPIAYLRPSIDIPYCHHEWWNGKGYPRGLQGEQIPLEARIFAITDVWDAITYPRPYRPDAMSKPEAVEFIRSRVDIHFDPLVAEKFFEVFGPEIGLEGNEDRLDLSE